MTAINYHRTGSGEPLLLIHGIGSRWQMWTPVLDRLAAERDVIAIDVPGFGASPRPADGTPAGIPTLTRLLIELLDELGLERPHVAGNSMGGWLSLELAKAGRASSATCLSPAGFHSEGERRFELISLAGSVRLARTLRPVAGVVLATPVGRTLLLSQLTGRPWRIPAPEAVETIHDLAGAPWFDETLTAMLDDHFSGGEQIDVPVTIAWGQRDRLLLIRQAPRAAAAIPGSRAVTLYGCGHVPTYDDPEQVAGVLLEGSSVKD